MTNLGTGVIAVVGATGTGKSALADALARTLGGEVISVDSMQVYRGMDIGTAKIPLAERSVPYHCIDLVEPDVAFTAALYQRAARCAIEEILARGAVPVVCGGTGLYVRAALDDFSFDENREAPSAFDEDTGACLTFDENRESFSSTIHQTALHKASRLQLTEQAQAMGAEEFHALLAQRDPSSAALIHPNNVRRVVRAFELLEEGTTYATQHAGFSAFNAFYTTRYIGIEVKPAVLYEALNRRVDG
ncbi:MAG: hypothetical protein FWD43_05065, partial [Coriobacteriia bacterium]|nr:hypothetical protein [Coriobacteriia bacterium]